VGRRAGRDAGAGWQTRWASCREVGRYAQVVLRPVPFSSSTSCRAFFQLTGRTFVRPGRHVGDGPGPFLRLASAVSASRSHAGRLGVRRVLTCVDSSVVRRRGHCPAPAARSIRNPPRDTAGGHRLTAHETPRKTRVSRDSPHVGWLAPAADADFVRSASTSPFGGSYFSPAEAEAMASCLAGFAMPYRRQLKQHVAKTKRAKP